MYTFALTAFLLNFLIPHSIFPHFKNLNYNLFLLIGRIKLDLNYMTYCDMWFEWDKLTEEQLVGLTSKYSNNCADCRVS